MEWIQFLISIATKELGKDMDEKIKLKGIAKISKSCTNETFQAMDEIFCRYELGVPEKFSTLCGMILTLMHIMKFTEEDVKEHLNYLLNIYGEIEEESKKENK